MEGSDGGAERLNTPLHFWYRTFPPAPGGNLFIFHPNRVKYSGFKNGCQGKKDEESRGKKDEESLEILLYS